MPPIRAEVEADPRRPGSRQRLAEETLDGTTWQPARAAADGLAVPTPRSPSPHAALFEAVFSRPEHAASELQVVLPTQVSSLFDWSSLALRPGSFRDADLIGTHVDLLFSVRCDGRDAFVYILFEHQSTTDALMPFRLLRYMVRIWEGFLRDEPSADRLPAILPVVLHHSKDGWAAPTIFSEIVDLAPSTRSELAAFVPEFRFLLDDVSTATDTELHRRSVVAAATLFLLRDARRSTDLLADLRRWFGVLRTIADAPGGVAALGPLLQYAFQVGDIPRTDLRTFAHQLGPAAVEVFMTTAEQIAEEVRVEERAKAMTTAQQIAEEVRAEERAKAMTTAQQIAGEARAEGEARGRAEGRADLVLRQLTLRFGPLPTDVTARIRRAAEGQLELWGERLLSAQNLEDVFR